MFILKFLAKLVKILRSNASPGQIAGGFVLGMIIGLTPLSSLHNLLIIGLIIILNVNISMAIFAFAIFSGFAYLLDPLFHSFGYFLLVDIQFMQSFYTEMYNIPILALSHFNNTVVMGSLAFSVILVFPMIPATKKGVVYYREKIDPKFQKFKVVQALKGSKIYGFYSKLKGMGG